MLHIKSLTEGVDIFKALGSDIRISIISHLQASGSMNINELAQALKVTNGALTPHIKKLEDCGIVGVVNEAEGHGNQKKCIVLLDKILVDIAQTPQKHDIFSTSIKVGHYSDFEVYPTCGLATPQNVIGHYDDSRYFLHPDRFKSAIIWFTKGYLEYPIPNLLPSLQKIDNISISLEISSEAPGYNDVWPSDIHFFLNDTLLGVWQSPGDFGNNQGLFTPSWWGRGLNQYGLLKVISIRDDGTFIDSTKLSDVSINDLNLDYTSTLKFKIAVPEDTDFTGGATIFGKGFGNYNQDIEVKIQYSPMNDSSV